MRWSGPQPRGEMHIIDEGARWVKVEFRGKPVGYLERVPGGFRVSDVKNATVWDRKLDAVFDICARKGGER